MCKRRDSIAQVSAAADRLSRACEAEIRIVDQTERERPARGGVSRALRDTFRNLTATPADMAMQLKKLQ